jgi:hypothetical protein
VSIVRCLRILAQQRIGTVFALVRDNEWGRSSRGSQHGEASRSEHRGSEDADLREREYRDEQGNVHHTRTYMERHKGERDKK